MSILTGSFSVNGIEYKPAAKPVKKAAVVGVNRLQPAHAAKAAARLPAAVKALLLQNLQEPKEKPVQQKAKKARPRPGAKAAHRGAKANRPAPGAKAQPKNQPEEKAPADQKKATAKHGRVAANANLQAAVPLQREKAAVELNFFEYH